MGGLEPAGLERKQSGRGICRGIFGPSRKQPRLQGASPQPASYWGCFFRNANQMNAIRLSKGRQRPTQWLSGFAPRLGFPSPSKYLGKGPGLCSAQTPREVGQGCGMPQEPLVAPPLPPRAASRGTPLPAQGPQSGTGPPGGCCPYIDVWGRSGGAGLNRGDTRGDVGPEGGC